MKVRKKQWGSFASRSFSKDGNKGYPAGAIIYANTDDVLAGKAQYKVFVKDNKTKIVSSLAFTQSAILVNWLDNVKSVLERYSLQEDGSYKAELLALDNNGTLSVTDTNENSDDFLVNYESSYNLIV